MKRWYGTALINFTLSVVVSAVFRHLGYEVDWPTFWMVATIWFLAEIIDEGGRLR